jgi:hypothetical protein
MRPARILPLGLALALGCAHEAPPAPALPAALASLDQWAANHPEAAQELGDWVRTHPEAAARFFEWDAHHPERSRLFVIWAVNHAGLSIDVFVATHPDWPIFDQSMERHRPAAEAFLRWCRRHPPAAAALMNHPGALDWAGRHLYTDYWQNPGY